MNNEAPQKPGFRRNANDILGVKPGEEKFELPDAAFKKAFDEKDARDTAEHAAWERANYERAERQANELSRISVENAVMIAGSPALKLVAEHTAVELSRPKEIIVPAEADEAELESDEAARMTLREAQARIDQENMDTADYNGQTGETHPFITEDAAAYARRHGITIVR